MALDNKLEAIEGLVVDTMNGAIGFRNHSAPPLRPYGSTWTEDLLFVQPVTQCVDTNLTIEYSSPLNSLHNSTFQVTDVRLVDRGGFSRLNLTFPRWNRSEAQTNPDFRTRAYQAAWLNNVYAMKLLNVSDIRQSSDSKSPVLFQGLNATLGNEYSLPRLGCSVSSSPPFISTDNMFGCFAPPNFNLSFNITPEVSSDFISEDIAIGCEGGIFNDLGNLANPSAACGLVFGSSRPTDGGDEMSPLPGSRWTKPMYSCASGVQALIKTVSFAFNITDGVNGLTVLDIVDKTYPTESAKPLWGVENLPVTMDIMPPLWGLVSPEAAAGISPANLQTLRKESLFLPGASVSGRFPGGTESQNLAGVDFFRGALAAAYGVGPISSSNGDLVDYSGRANVAMSPRWRELSGSAGSMARVLNLIWTDYAANSVLGTKGLASTQRGRGGMVNRQDGTENGEGVTVPVTLHDRQIKYDLRYAVPAVLVLAFLLLASISTSVALLFGRTSPAKMRRYLNATSAGRILASTVGLPSGKVDNDESGRAWVKNRGRVMFSAGRGKPVRANEGGDRGTVDNANKIDTGH